jgi:DNA-binding GntR family transcriptional regulator
MKHSTAPTKLIEPPKVISEQVYTILKERILLGEIPCGHRMIECTISADLQTSRTPIRESFHRLIQDGLVERVPQGGVRVCRITPQMIKEVYGIRAVLEEYAGELACENITPDELARLKEMLPAANELLHSPEGCSREILIEMWSLNTTFHETIYRAARSEQLLKTLSNLKHLVIRFRFLSMRKTRIRAWEEHTLMVEYLEKKDRKNLKMLMKSHTLLASEDALKTLDDDKWVEGV